MSSLPLEGGGSGGGGRSRKQPNGHRCPVGEDCRRPSRRSAEHLPLVPPTLTLPLRGGGNLHHASRGEGSPVQGREPAVAEQTNDGAACSCAAHGEVPAVRPG